MGANFIQVPPNSTGSKVRTQDGIVGADTVHQHYMIVADESFNAIPSTNDSSGRGLNAHLTNATIEGTVDAAFGSLVLRQGVRAAQTNPTAVSDADSVGVMADDTGKLVVVCSGPRDLVTQQTTQITAATTETTILTAGAGGVYHDLTALIVTNKSAVQTSVTIKDATTGTTRMILDVGSTGNIPLFFNPPFKQSAATANWTATLSAAATTNFTLQAVKNV